MIELRLLRRQRWTNDRDLCEGLVLEILSPKEDENSFFASSAISIESKPFPVRDFKIVISLEPRILHRALKLLAAFITCSRLSVNITDTTTRFVEFRRRLV